MSQNGYHSSNGAAPNDRVDAKGEMKFSYGGQAVIEGVMMRGAHTAAIAVRDPNGQIVVHEQPLNATLYRGEIRQNAVCARCGRSVGCAGPGHTRADVGGGHRHR